MGRILNDITDTEESEGRINPLLSSHSILGFYPTGMITEL
jgi:hypothetical protein